MTSPTPAGPGHAPALSNWPRPSISARGLTTVEAAVYTGIAESTLGKKRVYGGGPRFVRTGRSIRYLIDDLDAYMTERRYGSTSEYTLH